MTQATEQGLKADAAITVTILFLGLFLSATGLELTQRWHRSAERRQAVGVDDLLGAVALTAGLVIVVWWIASGMMATAAAILDRQGQKRAAVRAGRLCPAFMRRLAVAVLSAQLLSAPLANAAEPPAGPAWVPTTTAVSVLASWAPTAANAQTPEQPAITPVPRPQAPPTHDLQKRHNAHEAQEMRAGESAEPAAGPEWRPRQPVTEPDLLAAPPVRAGQDAQAVSGEVTVLAGDTLWDIASRQLGGTASDVEVALHWPRWYEANKAQIGENPHVLLPGQILKPPSTA
jgi:nucleoid-associated protein YgaU